MIRTRNISFVVLLTTLCPPIFAADLESAYPLKKGTRWTYVTQTGAQKITLVEGFTQLRVEKELVPAAVLRRTDGTDRLVIRSKDRWIECGPIDAEHAQVDCDRPIVIFTWPLKEGARWSGADLEFLVESRESLEVPAAKYDRAWKIAYMPPGGLDPLGEVWMVEGVGPVRILERETDYRLAKFEPGQGPDLPIASSEAAAKILESMPKPGPPAGLRLFRLGYDYLLGKGFVWLLFSVFLAALSAVGFGLINALRKRRSDEILPKISELEALSERNPGYPDLHYRLALALKEDGKFAEARRSLETALSLNPDYVEARLELGRLLLAAGKPTEAERELSRAAKKHPGYADVVLEWGKSLIALGDRASAKTAFERALQINPKLQEARLFFEKCLESAQKEPESRADGKKGG